MDTKSKHVAENAWIVTSFKIRPLEREALRKLARHENRTMSGQLRHIIQTLAAEVADEPEVAA